MDRKKLAEKVREMRAGYEAYHRKEIELARAETFEDRIRDFLAIAETAAAMGWLELDREFSSSDYRHQTWLESLRAD